MNFLNPKRAFFIALFCIFTLAATLRFFRLDQVPAGMSWDEVAIGYNGFAIWTVHRDEWLQFMPISFQSFGDYKAPFAIYLNGIFTLVLGLNIWVIRLPFVLSSIVCIAGMTALLALLFNSFFSDRTRLKEFQTPFLTSLLIGTCIFAFSPWHFLFSRAGFESGIALTFVVWGVVAFLFSLETQSWKKFFSATFSATFFALSIYTYHSAKIFTPLLLLLLLLFFSKKILNGIKIYALAAIIGIALLLPVGYDSIWGKGATRFSQTSIIGDETLTLTQKTQQVGRNFVIHFSPSFLVGGETTTLRHGDGHWGVLYLTEFLLCLATLCWLIYQHFIIKNRTSSFHLTRKLLLFGVAWVMIGFIPAAIGFETPHSNRALLSYPGFVLIEAVGVFLIFNTLTQFTTNTIPSVINKKKTILIIQSIIGTFLLIQLLLSISFFHDYFTRYSLDSVSDFNYGYEQAFEEVIALEPEVDKIMFTSKYGQPYIYALFFRKTSPIFYHGGSLAKFEFPDNINVGDLIRKNALIVATPDELDPSLADSLIVAPNGEVRFVIIRTPNEQH